MAARQEKPIRPTTISVVHGQKISGILRYLLVAACVLSLTNSTQAIDPVSAFFVKHFAGRVIDGAWDAVTGKPDIRLINERLGKIEASASLQPEIREELRRLAQQLTDRVTEQEFRKLATSTGETIASIRQRLDNVEQRVEVLEVQNLDVKHGTTHATDALYFLARGEQFAKEDNNVRSLANFNACLSIDPHCRDALLARARLYAAQGLWFAVTLDVDAILTRNSEDLEGIELRCIAAFKSEDFDQCILDGRMLLQRKPELQAIRTMTAKAHYERGNIMVAARADDARSIEDQLAGKPTRLERYLTQIVRECSAAIELDPDCIEAYSRRMFVYTYNPRQFADADGNNGYVLALRDCATIIKKQSDGGYRQDAINRRAEILARLTEYASSLANEVDREKARNRISRIREEYPGADGP